MSLGTPWIPLDNTVDSLTDIWQVQLYNLRVCVGVSKKPLKNGSLMWYYDIYSHTTDTTIMRGHYTRSNDDLSLQQHADMAVAKALRPALCKVLGIVPGDWPNEENLRVKK